MLNFGLALHDIHDTIDPTKQFGLFCDDIYIRSPAYADDILMLSNIKHGLDNMITNAVNYARKWRFCFSEQKSKCMVFGESKVQHTRNKEKRSFAMGNSTLE